MLGSDEIPTPALRLHGPQARSPLMLMLLPQPQIMPSNQDFLHGYSPHFGSNCLQSVTLSVSLFLKYPCDLRPYLLACTCVSFLAPCTFLLSMISRLIQIFMKENVGD